MKEKTNPTVVKSNELIEASYKLSLTEQRVILSCISQVDAMAKLKKDDDFTITAKEYADIFGCEEKKAYTRLKEVADKLYERSILLRSRTGKSYMKTRWVSSVTYHEGEGAISIGFASKIIPHLTKLQSCFTSYKFQTMKKLTSTYAMRLYELIIQYQTIKKERSP